MHLCLCAGAACATGDDVACDSLSKEEEAKKAWLERLDVPAWGVPIPMPGCMGIGIGMGTGIGTGIGMDMDIGMAMAMGCSLSSSSSRELFRGCRTRKVFRCIGKSHP